MRVTVSCGIVWGMVGVPGTPLSPPSVQSHTRSWELGSTYVIHVPNTMFILVDIHVEPF